jgi:hypothetical protein
MQHGQARCAATLAVVGMPPSSTHTLLGQNIATRNQFSSTLSNQPAEKRHLIRTCCDYVAAQHGDANSIATRPASGLDRA